MNLPENADQARLMTAPAGGALHRNHVETLGASAFNPCLGKPTRFAPIFQPDGACIPTLYAATTFDGAAFETVFREPPSPFQSVPRQSLDTRAHSVISPRRDLHLARLFTPELGLWNLKEEELFRPSEAIYARCRTLAYRLWRDNPEADGIVWNSVRDSGAHAMLLFGDRLDEADFKVSETHYVRRDEGLLERLRQTGARGGHRISR